MGKLKVLIVGTSAAETLRLEEVLQQTGYLDQSRYLGSKDLSGSIPNWFIFDPHERPVSGGNGSSGLSENGYVEAHQDGITQSDLICFRYTPESAGKVLAALAPALREARPPIFALVDDFDPELVLYLLNAGVRRVLPFNDQLEKNMTSCLQAVFGANQVQKELPETSAGFITTDQETQDVFHASPVGMAILRAMDGVCLACNDAFARLLDWPRAELIGSDPLELAITSELSQTLGRVSDLPGTLQGVQMERKIYTRRRQLRQVLLHVNRFQWAGENCLLVVVQDMNHYEQALTKARQLIDELERLVLVRTGALEAANRELAAEISRRKSVEEVSERLEQVLWSLPDVVAICNPDGSLRYLNRAGRRIFQINERRAIGEYDLSMAYPPASQKRLRDEIFPAMQTHGIWSGELELILPDGDMRPVSQVFLAQVDDHQNLQSFTTIARDLSEIHQKEKELWDSREQYRLLAEAAHDLIFLVTPQGIMEYANRFACQALNLDPDQVPGMSVVRFFPDHHSALLMQMISEVQSINSPIYFEGLFNLPEREYWLGFWLAPVHNRQGQLSTLLGIARDITEQRKTDDALKRALENEKQLSQLRSQFFSMTSHQFRTPLSTIMLSAEMLRKYGAAWEEDRRTEYLGRIYEGAQRLSTLLDNILMVSRVDSGNYRPVIKPFDLVEFCQNIIQELVSNDRNEHLVQYLHEADTLPVYTDAGLLGRVMDNLLSNALKYSPAGSTVKVSVWSESDLVMIEVSDEGIGIPEQDLKNLFEPFHRAGNTDPYPGTGIGLTIVQKSVELLKGNIFVKSKEGQGATFVVRFPAQLAAL